MGFWKSMMNLRFLGVLPYASYVSELLLAIRLLWGQPGVLSERLAEILFGAVDQYTKGLASRQVNRHRLTAAVRGVVDVFVDIFDGENAPPLGAPEPASEV